MAKPTWSEIQDFGEWLVTRGFETDRDRTRFIKGKEGVCLEFWISKCANGSFKCLNAQIQLKFVETWCRSPVIARTFSFIPCKTLSREFVMMCEQQHRMVELETESFFTKVANLVAEKNNEIKEIHTLEVYADKFKYDDEEVSFGDAVEKLKALEYNEREFKLELTFPKEFREHFQRDQFKDSLGRLAFDMRELFKEKMMHKSSVVCMLSGLAEVELIEKIRDAVASGRVVV